MYDIQYNTGLYIQDTDINVDILQDSITVYRELWNYVLGALNAALTVTAGNFLLSLSLPSKLKAPQVIKH